jgi:hypothetical protein
MTHLDATYFLQMHKCTLRRENLYLAIIMLERVATPVAIMVTFLQDVIERQRREVTWRENDADAYLGGKEMSGKNGFVHDNENWTWKGE